MEKFFYEVYQILEGNDRFVLQEGGRGLIGSLVYSLLTKDINIFNKIFKSKNNSIFELNRNLNGTI